VTTTFRGCGSFKTALFDEIATAYAGREFTFAEVKNLPSFDYRAYMRLYNAGLLRFSRRGKRGVWRVVQYKRWDYAQPSSEGAAA
jgi:hypothetical protein